MAAYEASGSAGGGYTVANRNAKKIEPEKLEAYMNEHPDAFLKEIAEAFSCCIEGARKALARSDYTHKKRRSITKNAMRKRATPIPKR
jgi:hypothetical protein